MDKRTFNRRVEAFKEAKRIAVICEKHLDRLCDICDDLNFDDLLIYQDFLSWYHCDSMERAVIEDSQLRNVKADTEYLRNHLFGIAYNSNNTRCKKLINWCVEARRELEVDDPAKLTASIKTIPL